MDERGVSKINLGSTSVTSASCLSEMKARQSTRIAEIREALVAGGFDRVAKASSRTQIVEEHRMGRFCRPNTNRPVCQRRSSIASCDRPNSRRPRDG